MWLIFIVMRIYPYWALPSIYIMIEVAIFFRRKNHFFQYWAGLGTLLLLIGLFLWFFYRGDLHSDEWIKALLPY